MPLSEFERRRLKQQALTGVLEDDRAVGIGVFPELNANTAQLQLPPTVAAPKAAPVGVGTEAVASRELSRPGLMERFIADGMDVLNASMLIDDLWRDLPDSQATINYDRLDAVMTRNRYDVAAGAAE